MASGLQSAAEPDQPLLLMTRPAIPAATMAVLGTSLLPLGSEPHQELPPLVVTALRGSVLPEHFSGNATVIDETAVADSGVRSLGELLATQGGLRVSSTSGDAARGTIHLRGFGDNAASRTLIMIDGKPLNRPDMGGIALQEIPLARVARVEILRGSQTARFGDQAVGGVINIVTKKGTDRTNTTWEIAAGSSNYRLARFNHSQAIHGQNLTLDAEQNQTDGWRENSMNEVTSLATSWSGRVNQNFELSGSLAWVDQAGRFPGPLSLAQYQQDPRQSIYADTRFADQYSSRQTGVRAVVAGTLELGGPGTLALPVAYQTRDLSWNFGPGSHTDNLLDTVGFNPVLRQSGSDWSIEEGVVFRQDAMEITQFREMARLRPSSHSELDRTVFGGFLAGEWEPWTDWHLNGAARVETSTLDADTRNVRFPSDPNLNFNRGSDETNSAWQLGIRWEPRLDQAAWFRYDNLYRLPTTDEIASYQGFPMAEPFNDQLHAETGHNLELGAEWTPEPWLLKVNAFMQYLNGEIAYDYVRNLNVNLAKTHRLGGEVELAYQAESWTASIRYAGIDATYADGPYDGSDICLVPNHQVSSILELRPHRALVVQLEHQLQSAAFEGNDFANTQPKLPAISVTNLMLRYQPKDGLSCYVRINNLFDEDYATVKYSGLWYPAAGRQLQCGMRYEF
jgi:iron complex outermembrane receptor protein